MSDTQSTEPTQDVAMDDVTNTSEPENVDQPTSPATPEIAAHSESNPFKLPVEEGSNFVLGFDIGDEKCIVAIGKEGEVTHAPYVLHNSLGDLYHMNWISYGDRRVIGTDASSQLVLNTEGTVYDIKSLIGAPVNSQTKETYRFPLKVESIDGQSVYTGVEFNNEVYLAGKEYLQFNQLLGSILRQLSSYSESDTLYWQFRQKIIEQRIPKGIPFEKVEPIGKVVSKCVIAVPASFNAYQRAVVLDAGRIAGLEVIGLIDEAVASVLTYADSRRFEFSKLDSNYSETLLIADLGQQYFHVAIATVGYQSVSVLSSISEPLGTAVLRKQFLNRIESQIREKYKITTKLSNKTYAKLDRATEKAIKVLSSSPQTVIEIDNFISDTDISIVVTRSDFEATCEGTISGIKQTITKALSLANIENPDELKIELIGGGCRIPAVQSKIQQAVSNSQLHFNLDSNNSVAIGAGIFGSLIKFEGNYDLESEKRYEFQQNSSISEETIQKYRLSQSELEDFIEFENKLSQIDREFVLKENLRNSFEQFIYHFADKVSQFKSSIPSAEFDQVSAKLEEEKQFLLFSGESESLSFAELSAKFEEFKKSLDEASPVLKQALDKEVEEKRKEDEAAAEAAKSRVDSVRDKISNPRTPKEKLDAAIKRKEQGNTFFADNNFEHAATRYVQAINLLEEVQGDKFTDDVNQTKLSCYLNLAQSYINLKQFNLAIGNCDLALRLDGNNTKALFRRGKANYSLKKFAEAKKDFAEVVVKDPSNTLAAKQIAVVEKAIALEIQKEKQMYAKMFS